MALRPPVKNDNFYAKGHGKKYKWYCNNCKVLFHIEMCPSCFGQSVLNEFRSLKNHNTKQLPPIGTFVHDCVNGTATAKDINNYVMEWYNNGKGLLSVYLGISKKDCRIWVRHPYYIKKIIRKWK